MRWGDGESPQTCKGHPFWVCCQLAVLCKHSLWPNQPLSCFAYGHPAFAQIIGARTEEIKSYTNSHRQLLPWLAARQPCAAPLLARPPGDARRRALLPREPRALPTNGPSESRCRLVASRPSALRRISMADNYDDDEFEDYDEGAHAGYSHRPA